MVFEPDWFNNPYDHFPPEKENEMPRLSRDAFLYLDNLDEIDDFAQCSTCRDWVEGDDRCFIHGSQLEVLGTMSCGFYVCGTPLEEGSPTFGLVSPMESGLVDREVRCENCRHLVEESICGFFKTLNEALPELFALDIEIDRRGCCNAQQPKS